MKKINLGISIYPEKQKIDELKKYVKLAKSYGYNTVFTSMLQVTEENKEELLTKFKEALGFCRNLGFETVLDIAPNVFETLNIKLPNIDLFKELNAETIRIDQAIGNGIDAKMINQNPDINFEFNASMSIDLLDEIFSNVKSLDNAKSSHNFYPQKYTGLSKGYMHKQSKYFKEKGMRVRAWISSLDNRGKSGPWKINEGLCTLEEHRNISAFNQAQELMMIDFIDDISFGDMASHEELKLVSRLKENKAIFKIDVEDNLSAIEKHCLFEYDNHFRRADLTDYFIRSTQTRIYYKDESIYPASRSKESQKIGEVYILNDDYDTYKAEVHIITKEIPFDSRKNLVGKISKDQIRQLKLIGEKQKFSFEE